MPLVPITPGLNIFPSHWLPREFAQTRVRGEKKPERKKSFAEGRAKREESIGDYPGSIALNIFNPVCDRENEAAEGRGGGEVERKKKGSLAPDKRERREEKGN